MPLERSEAFILRTFHVGEQDKIVVFLAKNKGIVKGIAKGARKFGNRFGSGLEPLSHVNLQYYEKEHKDLVVLNNCDLIESNFDLQSDVDRAFILSYFSELIEEFFSLPRKRRHSFPAFRVHAQGYENRGRSGFVKRLF